MRPLAHLQLYSKSEIIIFKCLACKVMTVLHFIVAVLDFSCLNQGISECKLMKMDEWMDGWIDYSLTHSPSALKFL